jgi:TolB-like protein/Tfp pilus assembly protein PilF
MSFIAELRRRNVIRMAGLYLVGAWLITQVAGTVLPMFDVPTWVLRSIVVLLAIGFIPALVVSWIFELTPEGLRRETDTSGTDTAYQGVERRGQHNRDQAEDAVASARASKQIGRAFVVVLLAALTFFVFDKFYLGAQQRTANASASTPLPATATPIKGLIAVLPFRNRSGNAEDAYFVDGIHDDLLTQLSKVTDFKVISRTSMMHYVDTKLTIPEIARELGAAVVLEGGVQRAGNKVRINVQLIDGATDVHLWAETYDRALNTETLFTIQADIAQAIANSMKLALSPADASALAAGSTRNLQAYEAFMQGKLLAALDRATLERMQAAIQQFDRAIALDPQFADAWSRKARAQLTSYWYGFSDAGARDAAIVSMEQARRLAPEALETWIAQAYLYYWGSRDYTSAESVLARVIERAPGLAEAWYARGLVARRDGRFADAIASLQHSLDLDPLNTDILLELSNTMISLGQDEEAAPLYKRLIELGKDAHFYSPESEYVRGNLSTAWAGVKGPNEFFAALPFRIAVASRNPQWIKQSLSEDLWPERLRQSPDYPENYAFAEAEGLLATGQVKEGRQHLAEIKARLDTLAEPYPAGWSSSGEYYYYPCLLPGLMGDLAGVRAAEKDYLENAPKDAWADSSRRTALAVAFARAGDPDRALYHMETVMQLFGPFSFVGFKLLPGLDSLRDKPRYLAMQDAYERWNNARKQHQAKR